MKITLDTLPIKTLIKIIETGQSHVLGGNHKKKWARLYEEYKKLDPKGNSQKVLELTVKIDVIVFRQRYILQLLEALKFDSDVWVLETLKNLGYEVKKETYFKDIARHEIGVKSLDVKIAKLRSKLPKQEEGKGSSIDEVIIAYCSILGLSYDTNKVSVTQYLALQKSVENKIKSLDNAK